MISSVQRIDAGNGLSAMVTVHRPDSPPEHPVVAVALPGGGYARGYFDIRHEGAAYSQAAYHTSRGWYVVACDHLGTGDSDRPDDSTLTLESMAEADAASVRGAIELLQVCPRLIVGIGQSMGGCLAVVTQARHRVFDAIAVLGFSALAGAIPTRGQDEDFVNALRWAFHSDDTDPALVDADFGSGYPDRRRLPPWGSSSMPSVARTLLTPGIVAHYARTIDVPVLIGCGQRDLVPVPHAEPSCYPASKDVTIVVVPRMAHMHNFARTRELLWSRLHGWAEGLGSPPRG